jgi:hypothetical protein
MRLGEQPSDLRVRVSGSRPQQGHHGKDPLVVGHHVPGPPPEDGIGEPVGVTDVR